MQEIKVLRNRLEKLDIIIQNLYEDRVTGQIPDATFKNLLTRNEQERVDKETALNELESRIAAIKLDWQEINLWVSSIKQYANTEKLDAEILLTLVDEIDKIVVGEPQIVDSKRFCDIQIVYKYVGDVSWIIENGGELYDEAV